MKRILVGLVCAAAMSLAPRAEAANPVVVMKTSAGTIKIELYEDKAPITVKNFLKYVEDKHYDGLIFHRIIPTFMIQGGGFEKGITSGEPKQRKTRPAIKNESTNGLSNKKYTIAMARTGVPDSATSQFFINVEDNDRLDKASARDGVGYCVFGKVIEGTDVVDKIKKVRTTSLPSGMDDVPVEDVVIESAKIEKK